MHLTPGELIDLLEGAANDASERHVSTCASCQAQLADVRAMLAAAKDDQVPEPSPLFWQQFSERVRDAVSDHGRIAPWWNPWLRMMLPLAGAAVTLVFAVFVMTRPSKPPIASEHAAMPLFSPAERQLLSDPASADGDPSLVLVADLMTDMDWDTAMQAGLTTRDSAEQAVSHLSDRELSELQRLLAEALARRGA